MKTISFKKTLCNIAILSAMSLPVFNSSAFELCEPARSDNPPVIAASQGESLSLRGFVNWSNTEEFTVSVEWTGSGVQYLSNSHSEDVTFSGFISAVYELTKTVTSNLGNVSVIPYTIEVIHKELPQVEFFENSTPTKLVTDYGMHPDDNIDDSVAFKAMLENLNDGDVIEFPSGTFIFEKTVRILDIAKNITIQGNTGTVIKKTIAPGSNPDLRDSLIFIDNSEGLIIQNLSFVGVFNSIGEAPRWTHDGLYIGSANDAIIRQNTFFGFGDACLRVNTSPYHEIGGIYSNNVLVSNNVFEQCMQISTTIKIDKFGGVNNLEFSDNTFKNMRGPLKLATRQPTFGLKVIRNKFINGYTHAMDILGYSDVEVKNNLIKDYPNGYFLDIRPNDEIEKTLEIKNIDVSENVILNTGRGLRIQPLDIDDELIPMSNVKVERNYFENTRIAASATTRSVTLANYYLDIFTGLKINDNIYWEPNYQRADMFLDMERIDRAADIWEAKNNVNHQIDINLLRVPKV
ncbi:glycosyl hydrolase family 28-related protein [Motilimonas sp. 1_MG-2023]|uniref:right-handed parallel beta-helix repeat-containing protein n=1 Tax=Motilimonas sp. 1_MG-2023 TaxID=3062672 RepID=UPI0026E232C1|nr:glycosyl hydrolase family 28-related protein [Motilimonas sp. 1_MG-2023]MDO6528150.1 glycosyl hydrolase family 28-related protein [Motilimonas sp. 1_MG-2023]